MTEEQQLPTNNVPEQSPQNETHQQVSGKTPLTKKKYFIHTLVGLLVVLFLGSYALSWSAKKNEEAALIPTPTPTPFQTYTGLETTPLPVYGSYILERKKDIYTDKILSFAPTQYYNDDHQLTRWKDYLLYVEELPAETEPYQKKLMQLNITTGEKKVIYDSKSFNATAKEKFAQNPYRYQLPFHIIENSLFFSIITEGIKEVTLGPVHTFIVDLTTMGEAQKIAEIGGYTYHSKGQYWINPYLAPSSGNKLARTYALLDPKNRGIMPLKVEGRVITITNDEILFHVPATTTYPSVPASIKRIELKNPTEVQDILPSSQMPADITDVGYISSKNHFFLVGPKAFYLFKRETNELEEVVKVNDWTGAKLSTTSLNEPLHTAHVDEKEAFIPIGNTSRNTPICYIFSFAEKTFTRMTRADAKCQENMKDYNTERYDKNLPPDDLGPEYKTLEEKIKSLKLPKEYVFRGM